MRWFSLLVEFVHLFSFSMLPFISFSFLFLVMCLFVVFFSLVDSVTSRFPMYPVETLDERVFFYYYYYPFFLPVVNTFPSTYEGALEECLNVCTCVRPCVYK